MGNRLIEYLNGIPILTIRPGRTISAAPIPDAMQWGRPPGSALMETILRNVDPSSALGRAQSALTEVYFRNLGTGLMTEYDAFYSVDPQRWTDFQAALDLAAADAIRAMDQREGSVSEVIGSMPGTSIALDDEPDIPPLPPPPPKLDSYNTKVNPQLFSNQSTDSAIMNSLTRAGSSYIINLDFFRDMMWG